MDAVVDETRLLSNGIELIWGSEACVWLGADEESGELDEEMIGGPGRAEEASSFIDRSLQNGENFKGRDGLLWKHSVVFSFGEIGRPILFLTTSRRENRLQKGNNFEYIHTFQNIYPFLLLNGLTIMNTDKTLGFTWKTWRWLVYVYWELSEGVFLSGNNAFFTDIVQTLNLRKPIPQYVLPIHILRSSPIPPIFSYSELIIPFIMLIIESPTSFELVHIYFSSHVFPKVTSMIMRVRNPCFSCALRLFLSVRTFLRSGEREESRRDADNKRTSPRLCNLTSWKGSNHNLFRLIFSSQTCVIPLASCTRFPESMSKHLSSAAQWSTLSLSFLLVLLSTSSFTCLSNSTYSIWISPPTNGSRFVGEESGGIELAVPIGVLPRMDITMVCMSLKIENWIF